MNNKVIKNIWLIIINIFKYITDLLIPKEEKIYFLESLNPEGLYQNIPRADNFDFETDKIKAIFNYKTPLCRKAIWEIKYYGNKKLIRDFSLLLYDYILEELIDLEDFVNFKKPILIPIPASKERDREKGFNQCILIVRELIKIDKERNGNNFTSLENFLIKKNNTVHQAKVSNRKARLKNLINTFSINKSGWANFNELSEYSFIIIDDVITTGATMNEAFRALKAVGINKNKIRGFALAH